MALSVAANDFEHRRSQDAVAVSASGHRHGSLSAWLARGVRACVCGCLKGLKACFVDLNDVWLGLNMFPQEVDAA